MGRHIDVFSQYTVNLTTKTSVLDSFSKVTMGMIKIEIWADTVADFPTFHVFAEGDNLASAIGAGNEIFLLAVLQGEKREVCIQKDRPRISPLGN